MTFKERQPPLPENEPHKCEPAWDGELEDETRLFQDRAALRREVARLEGKLLDRTVNMHTAIGLAQAGRVPDEDCINFWRVSMGWHKLGESPTPAAPAGKDGEL